ncbi:hypothetical protein SAM23877_7621 [Streptomyces ambofaciens ATCC 23877]|uniref:Uncharacterized protein SAMT0034 n=1 Tax=Streptomyces ambofaciens (strain ATCC 23877 / 3486 / DSM 40053 / JCM 4204 / NBRC 12836 / NRRL B-2516) TaxID=278992 RepID=Q1RR51_STRA7|nr:hypothetical protein [Streptomyces ambofaciens]AKZ53098.1 hypothetical protein SAM23877_0049 [Streptomyces ambofaciens ATCC 23877]AKZ60662.1 hypothetical protein SAM23877_7621 [Streptomyces ambofaciens ATCC 23877]CAI77963.1 conserved hypothetical protein [Streptomyces ambofaciens ATCC 23877]CAI78237.1 conserved hypothetical protein [Streptomyces ambofaciens ATCC 23877]CAJ87744.1 conserved hypothetical protein [Streptomyces ambofaciens ATCC 23877]
MNALGRRMPCSSPSRHPSPATHRTTRAVQRTGRLLCWSLAAGMTTAATDLLLEPQAPWWGTVWLLPWYLTCLAIPAWAVLRAREKTTRGTPGQHDTHDDWDQAA